MSQRGVPRGSIQWRHCGRMRRVCSAVLDRKQRHAQVRAGVCVLWIAPNKSRKGGTDPPFSGFVHARRIQPDCGRPRFRTIRTDSIRCAYGARKSFPVAGLPVQFSARRNGGQITDASTTTDNYGIAGAGLILGSRAGTQTFTGTAGNLSITFQGDARFAPAIANNGVVNAASFDPNKCRCARILRQHLREQPQRPHRSSNRSSAPAGSRRRQRQF